MSLKEYTQLKYSQLEFLLQNQVENVRTYQIKKRFSGYRQLTVPLVQYKQVLREIKTYLDQKYIPPDSAHGFILDRNILTNAKYHLNKDKILRIDIKNFFDSIKHSGIYNLFTSYFPELNENEVRLLSQLCSYKNKLPQGFPTSPVLSNIYCRQLDEQLINFASENSLTYTRYADDLTFSASSKNINNQLYSEINNIINSQRLKINNKKVAFKGRHRRQIVTGIIVNNNLTVSKKYKKYIRAILFKWDKYGYNFVSKYYQKSYHRKTINRKPVFHYSLKGKIDFVGFVCGKDNKDYLKFYSKYKELYKRDLV